MEYIVHIAIILSIYAILALSLNLLVGYTGLLSISHAAFYGIGAYTVAIMMTRYHVSFWGGVLIGVVACMAVAFVVGIVMSRFREDYYTLVSLGFNIIVFNVLLNWQEVTKGPLGIPGIHRPEILGFVIKDNLIFLVFSTAVMIGIYFLCTLIVRSSFGRALKAIREDEGALQVFGYKTHNFKLAIFIITAGIAAIAGGLYATYITFIDPSTFSVNESIFVLSIIVLGGLASIEGSLIGSIILVLAPELFRFIGFSPDIAAQMRLLLYGALLVALMMYRPQGLQGEYKL